MALHPSSATLRRPDDGHKPEAHWGRGRSPDSIISATIGVKDTLPIQRYLLAFEAGTMPETHCGPQIRDLGARLIDLQDRRTRRPPETGQLAAAPAHPRHHRQRRLA
jgi:hypothetical protein